MKKKTVRVSIWFTLVLVFLFGIIIYKLCYVALSDEVDGIDLTAFADSRNIVKETLLASRGTIFASDNEILAQNVNSYTVIAYLSESRTTDPDNPYHVVDKEKTAKALAPLINMSEERILELLNYDAYQVELGPGGRGISELLKEEIEALELPGIDFIKSIKRYYPKSDFLSYVIGYAKSDENDKINGELGIELYYNEELEGEDGFKEYQQDVYGYQIANTPSTEKKAVSGDDIYLTIDTNIQLFAEQAMSTLESGGSNWATISVLEAKTGRVLATASSPSFDPNTRDIESYYDPFVSYLYEPGSTMKIFSFMAAMENGLYDGDEKFTSGKIMIDDYEVKDWNVYGWGNITFDEGFMASSNVAASILSQKLGRSKLKDFYTSLGLGAETGITLPNEEIGEIDFKYEPEVAAASFGQSMTVTAVSMLQAFTSIANKGKVLKPYIVDKIVDANAETIFEGKTEQLGTVASEETIKKIIELMRSVVNSDSSLATGKSYKVNNVDLIGKTGTAQIASSSGGYLTGASDYVKSFVGLFPGDDPEIIVYLVASKLTDSTKLPQATRELVNNVSAYLNLEIKEEAKEDNITLKSYINKNTSSSVEELKNISLTPIVLGTGEKIINQYPLKNTTMNKNDKVFLLTNSSEYKHINIKNFSRSDAMIYAKMLNLTFKYDGYGYVVKYSFKEGDLIDLTKEYLITLEPKYKLKEEEKE